MPRSGKSEAEKKRILVAPVDPVPLPGNLLHRLNALRRLSRVVEIVIGLSMLVGAASLLFLFQALCDWWFDLPRIARAGFLLADVVIFGLLYHRQLDRPLRKKIDLTQTALLVEKKWPRLQQSLVTAVELTEGRHYSTRGSRQLMDVVLQQARARATSLDFSEVISTRLMWRWVLAGSLAILTSLAVTAFTWPASLSLIERLFLVNVPLPTKTIVVPVTRDIVIPFGTDAELIAQAQGIIPTHGRVSITYEGSPPQDFSVNVTPDKPGLFSLTMHNVQNGFKYSFYLNDGHGPEFSVTPKVPPTIENLECEEEYPAYTGLPPRKLAPTDLSLLPGCHLKIMASSQDPIKSAKIFLQGQAKPIEATIGAAGTHLETDVPIPAKDVTGFSVHLVDQSGVASTEETIYPITLVPDHPPEIKLLEPTEAHQTITLRAKPVIAFEASDDYGIARLTLKVQVTPPPVAGGANSAPQAVQSIPLKLNAAQQGRHYQYTLDVSGQVPAWGEGDVVNYWIEAVDNNTATGPGVTESDHQEFTIVSLAAKQAEIFERLKANADEIDKVYDDQQKINNDVKEAIPGK